MNIYAIKNLLLQANPISEHYLNRYIKLIQYAIENPTKEKYTEKHHILPKSMFSEYKSFKENPWNKVKLSARQHFIAHWMLWRAFRNSSMACAFWYMRNTIIENETVKLNSRTYEKLRNDLKLQWTEEKKKLLSEKMTGEGNHMYGKTGENNPCFGQKRPNQSKAIKEYFSIEENKKIKSEQFKQIWSDPEFHKRMCEIRKEICSTEEYQEKISKVRKETWQCPIYREKQKSKWTDEARLIASKRQSELSSALWEIEEYQEKISKSRKKSWSEEEYRNKQSISRKKIWQRDSHKEKMSNIRKETWQCSERRKRQSESHCNFEYEIFLKNDKSLKTDNLVRFAKENGYSKSCLYGVLSGNRKRHKDIIKITRELKRSF